jgi:UDP-N-acetylglucosamine--dolichyl-phosphate N-acetylglucosaminephosphotransferase
MLLTVSATVLLGFTDDMIDLSWRYKLIFPFIIVIPLLSAYQGNTHILVIQPFSFFFGPLIELGSLYLLYITLLGIYATNTINIYAGINGL